MPYYIWWTPIHSNNFLQAYSFACYEAASVYIEIPLQFELRIWNLFLKVIWGEITNLPKKLSNYVRIK